jgi:ankyrin repeat protein
MLKLGADPNVPAQNGAPPIVAVIQLGLGVDLLDALIKGGARVDERSTPVGNTALIETSLIDDEVAAVPYIRALVAAGADVDARDAQQGWTALMHHAYQGPRPAAVKALVEAGADVRLKGEDGATALLLAERRLGEFRNSESDPGQSSGMLESRRRLLAECQEVIDILDAAEG